MGTMLSSRSHIKRYFRFRSSQLHALSVQGRLSNLAGSRDNNPESLCIAQDADGMKFQADKFVCEVSKNGLQPRM